MLISIFQFSTHQVVTSQGSSPANAFGWDPKSNAYDWWVAFTLT